MTCGETEKVKVVETVLKEAGFTVSQRCCSRPSCFDFAARRDQNVMFVKVQSDTEQVPPDEYLEFKVIADRISAASLMVSEKSRGKLLEADTVYSRYDVLVVTRKTFENIVLHKTYPLIQAGPGGYYVEIDGEAVKQRREKLELSIGELAEMTGISRRTLYGYERGMAKASVSTAYNLISILGIPVAKPVNVFKNSKDHSQHLLTAAKQALTENRLLQKIFQKLARFDVTAVRKAPFDFLIDIQERIKIIGGVANREEREINSRVEEILSVSRVAQAHPMLITEGPKPSNKDILCIPSEEISEIESLEDLFMKFK